MIPVVKPRVVLDRKGVGEVLRGAGVQALMDVVGAAVAEHARGQGHTTSDGVALPVEYRVVPAAPAGAIQDGRPVAQVTVMHPAGLGMQAKYGVLTKAASASGLEVTEK